MVKYPVALVDDHVMLRNGLASLINNFEHFFVILEADNGKDLQAQLAAQQDNIPSLVILDVNMPEMPGPETAAWIKANLPDTKILALSMSDNDDDIIKMLRNGADGYVLKNGDPDFLRKAMYDVTINNIYNTDTVIKKNNGEAIKEGTKPNDEIRLTDREREFLHLCCQELTYKEIAHKMGVSTRTVDSYREILFSKLSQKSRTGLAIYAIRHKIFELK